MKTIRFLFVSALVLCQIPATLAAEPAQAPYAEINVLEMTSAQHTRVGRELYRKGDFTGAAKVFEHILGMDCRNTLAQYHLQKIAQKGKEFRGAAEFLDNLPCEQYDFSEDDFLPAALYYERDNDLLLEQIVLYNRRAGKLRECTELAEALDKQVKDLTTSLEDCEDGRAADMAALQKELDETKAFASGMDSQIEGLKTDLARSQTLYRQEIERLGGALKEEKIRRRIEDAGRSVTGVISPKFEGTGASFQQTEDALARQGQDIAEKIPG